MQAHGVRHHLLTYNQITDPAFYPPPPRVIAQIQPVYYCCSTKLAAFAQIQLSHSFPLLAAVRSFVHFFLSNNHCFFFLVDERSRPARQPASVDAHLKTPLSSKRIHVGHFSKNWEISPDLSSTWGRPFHGAGGQCSAFGAKGWGRV